jgi:plastocyanin domain-containing protein
MDRFADKALIALGILITVPALAGTMLIPPPSNKPLETPEVYPDSAFGSAPSRVTTGVRENYAATEADKWDTGNPVEQPANRRPAGMTSPDNVASATEVQVPSPEFEQIAIRKKGVQEIALIAGDLGFFPKTFFVTRDIPVRLFVTGASKSTLCIMMDSFSVRKQVRSQKIEEITFTPGLPGQYRFYCPVNGMEGTMIVKELASNIEQK